MAGTRAGFHTTRWSLVQQAGAAESPTAQDAMNELCTAYWRPLYAEVRRRGFSPADAQDVTQDFFARLLRRQSFGRADRQRGRFRTFLLAALDHVLTDHWRDERAQKRGDGAAVLPLDADEVEQWYQELPANDADAAAAFDQRWALVLMERGLQALRQDYAAGGRGALFEALKPYLAAEAGDEGYAQAAADAGLSENSFRVAVHRFRKRFRDSVREQVEATVADPAEAAEEMRHLFGV